MTTMLLWLSDLCEAFGLALARAAERRIRRRLMRRRARDHRRAWR